MFFNLRLFDLTEFIVLTLGCKADMPSYGLENTSVCCKDSIPFYFFISPHLQKPLVAAPIFHSFPLFVHVINLLLIHKFELVVHSEQFKILSAVVI